MAKRKTKNQMGIEMREKIWEEMQENTKWENGDYLGVEVSVNIRTIYDIKTYINRYRYV